MNEDFNPDEILAGSSITLETTVQVPAGKDTQKVIQIYSEFLTAVSFEEIQLLLCLHKDSLMKSMAMKMAKNKYGDKLI